MILGCQPKQKLPHGRYIANVANRIHMCYDFRDNRNATLTIYSANSAIICQGNWQTSSGEIIFTGNYKDPISGMMMACEHHLDFDGDDLFDEILTVRFVHQ
jgi:hypothetical protein